MRQANSTSWNQCLKWRGSKGIVILKLMFFSSFEPWPYVSHIFPYAPTCFPYFFLHVSHDFSYFSTFPHVFQCFFQFFSRCSHVFPYFAPKVCHVFQRIPGSSRPLILFGHSRGAAPATCVAYRQNGPGEPWGIHPQISWCFFRPSCDSPVWKKSNFLIFKVN